MKILHSINEQGIEDLQCPKATMPIPSADGHAKLITLVGTRVLAADGGLEVNNLFEVSMACGHHSRDLIRGPKALTGNHDNKWGGICFP